MQLNVSKSTGRGIKVVNLTKKYVKLDPSGMIRIKVNTFYGHVLSYEADSSAVIEKIEGFQKLFYL